MGKLTSTVDLEDKNLPNVQSSWHINGHIKQSPPIFISADDDDSHTLWLGQIKRITQQRIERRPSELHQPAKMSDHWRLVPSIMAGVVLMALLQDKPP